MLIIRKRFTNSRARSSNLANYILRVNREGVEKFGWLNAITATNKNQAIAELERCVWRLQRLKEPVIHWVFSFDKNEEEIAKKYTEEIMSDFLNLMKLDGCFAIYGAHNDSESYHIHLEIVMGSVFDSKSRNTSSQIWNAVNIAGELCKKYNLDSPLWHYGNFYTNIKEVLGQGNWDDALQSIESLGIDIFEKNGKHVLCSDEWNVELSKFVGKKKANDFYEKLGPCPLSYPDDIKLTQINKKGTKNANFWFAKKACDIILRSEYTDTKKLFNQRIDSIDLCKERVVDEELQLLLYEQAMLHKLLKEKLELISFYKSVVNSVTYKMWTNRYNDVNFALKEWVLNKNRSLEVFNIINAKARAKIPLALEDKFKIKLE